MRRIQTYLDTETTEALTAFAAKKQIPLSTAVADIIKNHFRRDIKSSARAVLDQETKTYLLRILNTLNQVLMCVYDKDKVTVKADSVEACIQSITQQIQLVTKGVECENP
ncbi:MAG: hypothetical protein A3I77_08525 [Gammaproteobacteria bacterium RIFCSPLOWO2_02_FULL_42_14]|nr:MAG: hypothetical protein A3B71_07150 [Gammaproteobacteria bacterium RIFCSPHIGHO2_02_FULL_42_43]OGT28930.1 MAG: hypothetical protein A2624_02140 [Gammaproteobacteria bacterium RIFCSPHIGHO2_01_FULL_42_8]OGT53617.1 MAG: hypothetical protein A3E54_02730 [Gammaproteobacteria bacterium RIFCSPHIGHO2_12_FULL_41_25]OGT61668.1 MAG: hypothetical protein A3I77_08525 [Gammaproteobacteria bacterium RIFCSPLOWO2_02_FULL_42_14]OGT85427.1 MAG: hypothetical protein A3G86_08235 [Gammaproteobacteria bacterium R